MDGLLKDLASEGRVDSQGRFTLDLRLALEKLARFQLASPADFVLKVLTLAVAGGASFLKLHRSSHEVSLEWDGVTYTRQDLQELFVRLAHRDLAVALVGASRLGAVEFSSSGSRLVYSKESLEVCHTEEGTSNRLSLRRIRTWMDRLWPNSSWLPELVALLCFRGALAPLNLWIEEERIDFLDDLRSKPENLWLIGSPFQAPPHRAVLEPPGPGTSGYLWLGSISPVVSSKLVHQGLSHPLDLRDWPSKAGGVILFTSHLPTDVSGLQLQRDAVTPLADWALDQLAARLLEQGPQPDSEGVREALRVAQRSTRRLPPGESTRVPFFAMADGTRASLGELNPLVGFQGHLETSARPAKNPRVARADDLLLPQLFPHRLSVDHLSPDLPDFPEPILVRVPLAEREGHLGLVLGSPRGGWSLSWPGQEQPEWVNCTPRGVRAVLSAPCERSLLDPDLTLLYRSLAARTPVNPQEEQWTSEHLLEYLHGIALSTLGSKPRESRRVSPLAVMTSGQISVKGRGPGPWSEGFFFQLAQRVTLPRADGGRTHLLMLPEEQPYALLAGSPLAKRADLPEGTVLLGPGQLKQLQTLMGPQIVWKGEVL